MNHKAEPTIACVSDPAGERTLVVAARNGDEQAFETLFKRYQRKTLAVVLRYTRVVEDEGAEDDPQGNHHEGKGSHQAGEKRHRPLVADASDARSSRAPTSPV